MARGIIKTLGLAGAALTAWYFLDPKKGSDRRDSFMKSAKDLYNTAGDEIGRLSKDISGGLKDISGGLSDTLSKVTEMAGIPAKNGEAAQSDGGSKALEAQSVASKSEAAGAPISA